MRRVLLLILVFVHALWPFAPASAQDAAHVTDVVEIDGIIDARVADLVERRLEDADQDGLVVLQIDSPGTLGIDLQRLAEVIAAAPVPVVVWVGPPGSLLQGGAVVLLEAAHIAATSPRSGIGPGLPADLGNEEPPFRADGEAPASATERWGGLAAGLAEARGRNPDAVFDLFAEDAEAVAPQRALDLGIVDLAAQSIPGLLNDLDGREVETLGGTRTLVTEGDPGTFGLRFSELGPVERVLHAVASPTAAYVLLVLGLWALSFELLQPGFGLAGAAGALFVGLAAYALVLVPFSWAGLGLLLAGVGLYAADVRLRRLGLLSVLATVAFALGSVLVFGGVASSIRVSGWVVWPFIAATALFYGFALTVAVRASEEATAQRQSGLVGLVGESVGDLDPDGQVVVKGAMWQGRTLGEPIPGGTKVRVRRVEGLVLEVTAEEG